MLYIDPRILVAAGVVLSAVGTMMMAGLSLQADGWAIAAPGIIAGIGMGLFFVPLTAVAFGSVRPDRLDEAAGLYALMRGIGASIGIAVVSWLFVRQGQVHWDDLIAHITPFNPARAALPLGPWAEPAGAGLHVGGGARDRASGADARLHRSVLVHRPRDLRHPAARVHDEAAEDDGRVHSRRTPKARAHR